MYCECGCGGLAPIAKMTAKRFGHIKGQPCRFIKYHYRIPRSERFWPKVAKVDGDGCWEWTAARHKNGYGWFGRGGEGNGSEFAHRMSWILTNGPIPEGMMVCHKCDNRGCVRPDHLFLGTQTDNMRDASDKGRLGWWRRKSHCKRGHPRTPENVSHRGCNICKKERVRQRSISAKRYAA